MSHERHGNAQHPEWKAQLRGPTGRPLCRRCLSEVGKGRRTFCGPVCVEAFQVATGAAQWVRAAVWKRDQGRCAACGLWTERFEEAAWQLARWLAHRDPAQRHHALVVALLRDRGALWLERQTLHSTSSLIFRWLLLRRGWSIRQAWHSSSVWEADHIVPVVEGGGGCGLEGYRTLCQPCHAKETKALAARRAIKRKNPARTLTGLAPRPQAEPAAGLP